MSKCFKLKEVRFSLDMKKFFPVSVVRPWPRLPREAVAAPSLAGFKPRLDGAGSTLGWWKRSLPMAGVWNWMVCNVPSNPDHPVILGFDEKKWKFLTLSRVLAKVLQNSKFL